MRQTGNSTLTYSESEKFVNFVTHKDFAWALDEHVTRGLAQENVRGWACWFWNPIRQWNGSSAI